MDIFKQNKVLLIIIIVLILLNIVSIGGMWMIQSEKKRNSEMKIHIPPHGKQEIMKDRFDMLGIELRFDHEQMENFKIIRADHHKKIIEKSGQIHEKKRDILFETIKQQPDLSRIDSVSKEIGVILVAIEREISVHLIEIRNICRDEQKHQFDNIIREIAAPIPPLPQK